jgi:hypothetical protein
LGLYKRSGVKPRSEYSGWTESMDYCSNCQCYKGKCYSESRKRWTIHEIYAELQMTLIHTKRSTSVGRRL